MIRDMKKFSFFESQRRVKIFLSIITYIILILGAGIVLLPFTWTFSTSLKPLEEAFKWPPSFIPSKFMWSNYSQALEKLDMIRCTGNTLIVTFSVLVGTLFSNSLAAFGFARLRSPWKDIIFSVVLATMMLPYQVTLIPLYMIYRDLRWLDTFKPLTVPAYFGNAFYIFLLRQFFLGIPKEYDEAALIDGCSYPRIYWNIILPMARPVLITVAIFSFMGSWNDLMGPLIILSSYEKHTLALRLAVFRQDAFSYALNFTILAAGSIMMTLPLIIIFFFAQKYFIRGVVVSGLKG
jgi:ABC-type glycerol-3-phosphate transport system permease component